MGGLRRDRRLRLDANLYRFIADDPAKVAALDADLAALGDRFLRDGVMSWEYLLVTARRV